MASSTHGLLSPTTSTASTTIQLHSKTLPLARTHPLRPGSPKEIALINYVDDKILRITRRYAKKFSNALNDADDTAGYVSFGEVLEDLNAVFQVVWISGTPLLQVSYLLTLAGLFCEYMPAFPFERAMFGLVRKLDEAFAFLLRDQTDKMDHGWIYRATITDRVRIKSLVEETKVVAVQVVEESGRPLDLDGSETEEEEQEEDEDQMPDQVFMSLSKIYRRTIQLLGDSLV